MRRRGQGFTLLELMIALVVTVLLAGGTLAMVVQFSMTRERVTERLEELDRLQLAQDRLRQDFEQHVPQRQVADDFGNLEPALVSNEETLLTLTRHGWRRSAISPELRSDLQRVEYQLVPIDDERCRMGLTSEQWANRQDLEGECLIRRYRQHLEAEAENPWREQVILAPLRDIEISFRGLDEERSLNDFDAWPPTEPIGGEQPGSLRAVTVTVDFGGFSPARFVWTVPGALLPEEALE